MGEGRSRSFSGHVALNKRESHPLPRQLQRGVNIQVVIPTRLCAVCSSAPVTCTFSDVCHAGEGEGFVYLTETGYRCSDRGRSVCHR